MKLVALNLGLGCALLVTGCGGHDVAVPDRLAGARVAAMAEDELEAENPRMATGTLTCPDLRFEEGASVRCRRTTELSGGRLVSVRGTVTVTSTDAGGRLHVAMDDEADEFGLTGEGLAADVRQRYQRRARQQPSRVDCPYLRGAVGTTVTCAVTVAGRIRRLDVQVTAVDPAGFRTSYAVTGWATD